MTGLPPADHPQQQRRSKHAVLIGLGAGGGVLLLVAVCVVAAVLVVNRYSDPANVDTSSRSKPTTIRFEVTGTGPLTSLIFSDGIADTREEPSSGAVLPWSIDVSCCGDRDYTVVAEVADKSSLTCRILADGKLITQQTGAGEVTCRHYP